MAAAPKTPPPSRPAPEFDLHAALGEKLPAPEVIEQNGESVWALWSEVNKQHENRFADTAPASTLQRPSVDPGWAKTQPMEVPVTLKQRAVEAQPLFTLEAAMLVARRNNRVCPRPERWQEMHGLLPARRTPRGVQQPPAPPLGPAWTITAPLTKRLLFREHVEWAEAQGVLENIMSFMQQMPESDWLHMGED